tara:strand:+ start:162 stop:1454 length:1293 start_codon:yes stop_codon:yes gene_type:complete
MNTSKLKKNQILINGTVLDPFNQTEKKADIHLENGKIKQIGKISAPKNSEVLDCKNLVITHGFFDAHVHFREPGEEDKEDLNSGSLAALAGGFTGVCAMPNTNPPIDSPELTRYIIDRSEECPINIFPIGAITKAQKGKEITEMGAMIGEGAIAFSDDGLPISNAKVMQNALEYSSMFDIPIINHAEDECLKGDGVMHMGKVSTNLGLPSSPGITESSMVHRDLEIAVHVGARLHVPHVSSARSVEHIKTLKKKSEKISAEVTAHHLFFTDEDLMSYNTNLKVAPPIRSKKDKKTLIAALKSGIIDCIATDHAPHTIEEKEGTFDIAPFGMIGLESCFGAVNKIMVHDNNMKLISLVKRLTVNPRKIMGINQDLFKLGANAEITIFDPDLEWSFSNNNIFSKSHNSPFINQKLKGRIKATIVKGYITILD